MANKNVEFGERLKSFRTLNGMTQGEVAQVLGVDRSTYTYYEKGRVPTLDSLSIIANLFSVSVAELIGERNDGSLDVIKNASRELHVESIFLRPEEKQLIIDLRLCTPSDKQKILERASKCSARNKGKQSE